MIQDKDLEVAAKKTEEAMNNIVKRGGEIISNQHIVVGETFIFILTFRQ
jgi:hypothetical protein